MFRDFCKKRPVKILIVEDEPELCSSIATYLGGENYVCETAPDFKNALDKATLFDYDCIILDLSLPGGSGLSILKELKAMEKMDGVLIISAKNSLDDKVAGLTLGADDYLPKPFHLSELSARVAAIIRRRNFSGSNLVKAGPIIVDTVAKSVTLQGRPVELTRKEYQLLLYFMVNRNRVLSKNAIVEHLWGEDLEGNVDFIYTHIKNLRKKITDGAGGDFIKSIYGMGYKFTAE